MARNSFSNREKPVLLLWDGKGAEGGRRCQEKSSGYGCLFLSSFSEVWGIYLICPRLTL